MIKDRWFTAVAVIALALGIGVNATVFTFVNAVLIRGLPFTDADRVLVVASRDAKGRDGSASYADFQDWRDATRTFASLSAFSGATMNLSDEGRAPERFQGPYISANAFKAIGQAPILGRDFQPDDDRPGAAAVVIFGNGVFKNRYGSDPSVVGRTVKVNEVPATVIGIMPEGFKYPNNADVWMPLNQMPRLTEQKRDARNIDVFGRLADRVTTAQAQSEMDTIARKLAADYPDTNKDIAAHVMTINDRVNGGPIKLIFLSLMGAVAFVLLIACANVANLLLARSAARAREMSVRISLGASRWRIVRQLLVESVLLSIISGLLGLALAYVGVRLFDAATQDVGRPYWIQFTMDAQVFAFFAAVCLGTGIVFGLAPALHVSKTDLNEVLKEGGRSGTSGIRARRWTSALIVAELALTMVLLAGAGLMIRSFLNLYRLDVGIETAQVLTMRLTLPNQKYPTPEHRWVFYERLDQRLAGLAGIRGATIATSMPLGGGSPRLLSMDGKEIQKGEQAPTVTQVTIGPRYFETLGIKVLRGRGFDDIDGTPGHYAAVINQRFAAMHFGTDDPIGRRIKLTVDGPQSPGAPPPEWATVVGLAPTIRQRTQQGDDTPDPVAYVPLRAQAPSFAMLMVRGERDAASLTSLLRDEVRARRSRPAAVRDSDHGSTAGAATLGVPRLRHDVRDLRRDRARLVGGRSLRGDGVFGRTAHAGDRRAHGARRPGDASAVADPAAVDRPDDDWPDDRHRRRARRQPAVVERAVPDGKPRSGPVDGDRLAARRRVDGRLCLARSTRDPARSVQCAAKRLTGQCGAALPRCGTRLAGLKPCATAAAPALRFGDRGVHVARRQDVIAIDADDEIVHVGVDLAEPVRHSRRHDDDVAGTDVPALPALNRRARGARPHQDRVDHVVGRHLARVRDRAAGHERSRSIDDVIDLGHQGVIDRALLRRLRRTVQHTHRDVVFSHVDDADLLIENAVHGSPGNHCANVCVGDVGGGSRRHG